MLYNQKDEILRRSIMFCIKCGKDIGPGPVKFCKYCGGKQTEDITPETTAPAEETAQPVEDIEAMENAMANAAANAENAAEEAAEGAEDAAGELTDGIEDTGNAPLTEDALNDSPTEEIPVPPLQPDQGMVPPPQGFVPPQPPPYIPEPAPYEEAPAEEPKKGSGGKIAAIAIALLLIIGAIVGCLLFLNRDKKKPGPKVEIPDIVAFSGEHPSVRDKSTRGSYEYIMYEWENTDHNLALSEEFIEEYIDLMEDYDMKLARHSESEISFDYEGDEDVYTKAGSHAVVIKTTELNGINVLESIQHSGDLKLKDTGDRTKADMAAARVPATTTVTTTTTTSTTTTSTTSTSTTSTTTAASTSTTGAATSDATTAADEKPTAETKTTAADSLPDLSAFTDGAGKTKVTEKDGYVMEQTDISSDDTKIVDEYVKLLTDKYSLKELSTASDDGTDYRFFEYTGNESKIGKFKAEAPDNAPECSVIVGVKKDGGKMTLTVCYAEGFDYNDFGDRTSVKL